MAVSATGDLEIDNLTLSGGSAYRGGAIHNRNELTISNSTITGNRAFFSGGSISNYGSLSIENSRISKNKADHRGGGLFSVSYAMFTITNSTITRNKAYTAGGIYNGFGGSLMVQNSTISKNVAKGYFTGTSYRGGYGGGISNDGNLTITNSTITSNKAFASGGIFNLRFSNMEISDSNVSENTASSAGGIGNRGAAILTNTSISGNKANLSEFHSRNGPFTYTFFFGGRGGGIINHIFSTFTITNSTISGNSATGKYVSNYFYGGKGGGIHNGYTSYLTLSNSMVTKNAATFFGGGLFNSHGGAYLYTPGTITGNKAKNGPNIYNVP